MKQLIVVLWGNSDDDTRPVVTAAVLSGVVREILLVGPKPAPRTQHAVPQRAHEGPPPGEAVVLPARAVCGPGLFREAARTGGRVPRFLDAGAVGAFQLSNEGLAPCSVADAKPRNNAADLEHAAVCCPPLRGGWGPFFQYAKGQ